MAIGLGYFSLRSPRLDAAAEPPSAAGDPISNAPHRMRLNGRACRDYRLISDDRSVFLDDEISSA
jgi:hypothetical protein